MPPIESSTRRRALLLLPPPPHPPTYEAVKAAYNAPLLTALRQESIAAENAASETSIFEVALPCDHLYTATSRSTPRRAVYNVTQRLVAALYKLICVISAKVAIPLEYEGGIDARIILVAYPRNGVLSNITEASPQSDAEGPVIDIKSLAYSARKWNTIYSVETEAGEQLLRNFLSKASSTDNVQKVRGGIIQVINPASFEAGEDDGQSTHHRSVAVGGTFDHLHIGHKLLLTMTAFMVSRPPADADNVLPTKLTVGITGDELLQKKKYPELLQSWNDRQRITDDFMRSILDFSPRDCSPIQTSERNDPGPNGHAVESTLPSGLVVDYVEIWDPFGPTITDEAISALVISAETRSGGNAVNDKRRENNWPSLEVFEVDVLDADEEVADAQQSFQNKLSSTEIRRSLHDRAKTRSKA